MSDESQGRGGDVLLGFLAGAALGAALALLFAPRSGQETRERLRRGLDEAASGGKDRAVRLRDTLRRAANDVERAWRDGGTHDAGQS